MDSGMFRGVDQFLTAVFIIAVVSVLSLIGIGVYHLFAPDKIESKTLIAPQIKITVEHNKIDTLYIYETN